MGHFADQAARRISRQPGIGVESNDVPYITRDGGPAAAEFAERRVQRAAQQAVQFVQFAALPLPSHPLILPGAPHPPPMQQQKTVARGSRAMESIQSRDACSGNVEQRCVPRNVFG